MCNYYNVSFLLSFLFLFKSQTRKKEVNTKMQTVHLNEQELPSGLLRTMVIDLLGEQSKSYLSLSLIHTQNKKQ